MFNQTTIRVLSEIARKVPERFLDACNSLNENQTKSKYWLVEKLNEYPHKFVNKKADKGEFHVALLAGWYGYLAYILIDEFRLQIGDWKPKIGEINVVDYDTQNKRISRILFGHKDRENIKEGKPCFVSYKEKDITKLNTNSYFKKYSIVINTSCEHIEQEGLNTNMSKIAKGTLVVLQSNNYKSSPQHINCSDSLEEFSKRYSKYLKDVKLYEKPFLNFTRYMIIGVKKK